MSYGDGGYGQAPYGGASGDPTTPSVTPIWTAAGSWSADVEAVAPTPERDANWTGTGAWEAASAAVLDREATWTGDASWAVDVEVSGLSQVGAAWEGVGGWAATVDVITLEFEPEWGGQGAWSAIVAALIEATGGPQLMAMSTPAGFPVVYKPFALQIVEESELAETPDLLDVTLAGALPDTEITFSVDGVTVYVDETDSMGDLYPTSIPIPELPAGTYELHATDGTGIGIVEFVVLSDPPPAVTPIPDDVAPAAMPGLTGVQRWVLQDPAPGGLGTWQMHRNPTVLSGPTFQREVNPQRTTYVGGKHSITEGAQGPMEWTLRGTVVTEEEHDQLLAFGSLNRRFWLIDERDRAWKVVFASVSLTPRTRSSVRPAGATSYELTDWVHSYDITVQVFSPEWQELT